MWSLLMELRPLPWRCCIHLTLLLLQLSCNRVRASCRILRCNSDFVAATLALGSSGGGGGAVPPPAGGAALNAGYCGALRSYAACTRRTARSCRGDLAYHSAVQGIEDLLIQHRCPRGGPTAQARTPPRGALSADACLYKSGDGHAPEYQHCAVFGDPHIRTFYHDFHTCAVQGAWPLIDNDFLYVQATSSPATMGSPATVITKITIIFKDWRQCVEQQLYQAELDHVPAAFADGSVRSGERRGRRSLAVRAGGPGKQVEIWAAHIEALLVVRQSGQSLSLAVRAPRAVVEAFGPERDLQLCVFGCPPSQRLDTLHPAPVAAGPAPAGAAAHCAALLPTRDLYYQACVFDVLASGRLSASEAAVGALQDARAMLMEGERLHLLPAAAPPSPCLAAMLLALGMLETLSGS